MGNMTDYLENKIVDHIFRGVTYTLPTQISIGLFTVSANDAGQQFTEVSGGSYARVNATPSLAAWSSTFGAGSVTAASNGTLGTTYNANTLTFPAPSANWGVVNAFGIFDAYPTGTGNMLFYGTLTTPKTINNGDAAPSFSPAALSVQIDT